MDILIISILPIHAHRVSSQLFVSPVSFINILSFSVPRSLTSSVKIIPKYFFGFDAFVNRIIFFISFSDNFC